MIRTPSIFLGAGLSAILAASCGGDKGGGPDASTCTTGDRGCLCYANSTCNGALVCQNDLCATGSVTDAQGTGPGSDAAMTMPEAGNPNNGPDSGMSAVDSGGGAVIDSGGVMDSGGGAADSGASATEGGSSCSDTQNDWQNCGSCGHVCANNGQLCGPSDGGGCVGSVCPEPCCAAGTCHGYWGACFALTTDAGPNTCTEACASAGATCATNGCGVSLPMTNTRTWEGFLQKLDCESMQSIAQLSSADCNTPLPFDSNDVYVRCCCVK